MAHLIEINNGVASYVENGRKERDWHGLGQVYDGQISVKEALELSHADYQVEMRNVFAMTPALQELIAGDGDMVSREQVADLITDALVQGRRATMRMMIYSVVLVSAIQQSELVLHKHVSALQVTQW